VFFIDWPLPVYRLIALYKTETLTCGGRYSEGVLYDMKNIFSVSSTPSLPKLSDRQEKIMLKNHSSSELVHLLESH
jgi:nitrate reductase beta subunit